MSTIAVVYRETKGWKWPLIQVAYMTALAYLFAVFRSRPSPFYVMDEVEAALDDVNLHRFLDLVTEFRQEAQLIIVSHQKRTMEAADCLYGVTMQPGGSSRVVSEKVGAGA